MSFDELTCIHFGWDLTYKCNYRCPYCRLSEPVPDRTVSEWLAAWSRINRRYGQCHIFISGGEPSVFPGFYDLVRGLAKIHFVDICTNLSWDVDRLVPELSPERMRISATFHPTQVKFETFLEKAVRVKDYLPERFSPKKSVYFVMYSQQTDRLEEYRSGFDQYGLVLIPLPLMINDTLANREEEKKDIAESSPNKDALDHKLDYQLQTRLPRGKLCRAGHYYAFIRGDASVERCTRYKDRQLGDFFSDSFALWDAPKICELDWCPFESQWIVEE